MDLFNEFYLKTAQLTMLFSWFIGVSIILIFLYFQFNPLYSILVLLALLLRLIGYIQNNFK